MSVYVDAARRPGSLHGTVGLWSRMTADRLEELHAAAQAIGLPGGWFHARCCQEPTCPLWFYDITETLRARAVVHGAQPVSEQRWVELLTARGGHCRADQRNMALP